MAWIDDIDVLNDASAASSDFSITSGFDSPTDNDSSATTPIYTEGSACGWMPLKKGATNGYNGTSVISGTPTLSGSRRICVGMVNYPLADIAAIPISSMYMRLSSATGFTTNYLQWDARAQIISPENVPISGHTFVMGHEDSGAETGTFSGNAESIGWVATTGNNADGKQGGFDWMFLISWVGAHSATLSGTFFSGLYSEYYDNEGGGLPGQTSRPIGVLSQAGDFFQSNISFQLGDGTSDTANIVVTETGKTIFFNNLHINHELGYVFVNPASTHEIRLTLTDCVHLWNDQVSTSAIFDGIANVDHFKLDGCTFSRGGTVDLPAYSTDRWVKTSKFDACGVVDLGDCTFEDNVIAGATLGAIYIGSTDTRRAKRTTYTGNTRAIEFDTAGTYTLDGDQFSGNTYDIHFSATTGNLVINAVNGANPSPAKVDNDSTGTVTINNAVTLEVTAKDLDTGSNIQNARVRLMKVSDDSVVLEGLTNSSGYISDTYNYGGDVPVYGWIRKSTGSPYYVQYALGGSITSSGYSVTAQMNKDS